MSIIFLEVISLMKIMKKYYPVGIVIVLLIIFLVGSMDGNDDSLVFSPVTNNEVVEEIGFIYVDIKGEVMNPGVYILADYFK